VEVKLENLKDELHITLTGRLSQCASVGALTRICALQEKITGFFGKSEFKNANSLKNVRRDRKSGRWIYSYHEKTIHFSILDLVEIPSPGNFRNRRKQIETTFGFEAFRNAVRTVLGAAFEERKFTIRGIYSDTVSSSIALKAYPVSDLRIGRLADRVVDAVADHVPLKLRKHWRPLLKAHSDGKLYFSVNILRFFSRGRRGQVHFDETVWESLQREHCKLKKTPIEFRLAPELVFSDAYLSNPSPTIS
jgi:hypothetical protein